jgi:peptidoglycan/LPS O-acetylase OafA/YrhL
VSDVIQHPALDRLARFDERQGPRRPAASGRPAMGYQPSLDGVRAFSVIAVILYHAGFTWMSGGFFGVEVFFVVSGFLITSLLIEERDRVDTVNLWQFWVRRWRRLLPALFTMLVVIGVWAVFWGSAEQHTQVRRDYPWGIFYLANWGQIFSQTSYFSGTPGLFRHLWSLAVEEQWYLIWPLVFIVIAKKASADRRLGRTLVIVSLGVMVATAACSIIGWPTKFFNPFTMSMQAVDTTNFLYLSTFTRSSGLLLGAAMAFLWRPWRVGDAPRRAEAGRALDIAAVVAVVVLFVAFLTGHVAASRTYVWMLPMVTIASAALVAVVVHPWAARSRSIFGSKPMVEIGKRSYGLYLWTWPISRITDAYHGSWSRFLLAMAIALPVSEACYRWIETPIRKGVLGRWWNSRERSDWRLVTACLGVSTLVIAGSLFAFYRSAPATFDAALDTGDSNVVFDPNVALGASTTVLPITTDPPVPTDGTSTATDPTVASTTVPAVVTTPVTTAALPRQLVIVGDSMAHSLARNLPSGIDSTFAVADGSVEGCSVYDSGKAVSSRDNYTRSFNGCAGWDTKWASAAKQSNAQVALVVIGAWDVFDVSVDGTRLPFGSPGNDERFTTGVQRGIDALTATGAKVALLEIACMRPQDVKGAGVPALPERGMDDHVAHLNDLLRGLATANAATTTFVTGPAEYCTEPIASDLAYRWDGVHAYKPGAKLTFEAIAQQLLSIPVP